MGCPSFTVVFGNDYTEVKFCTMVMRHPSKPAASEPKQSYAHTSSPALLSTSTSLKNVHWLLEATLC